MSTKDYLCLELLNLVAKREAAAADALSDLCSNGNLILPFLFTNGSHVCKSGLQGTIRLQLVALNCISGCDLI